MNLDERVRIYNQMNLVDKEWFFQTLMDNDLMVFDAKTSTLHDGCKYNSTMYGIAINGTKIQLIIPVVPRRNSDERNEETGRENSFHGRDR
jgi:hypothetical protein|tara:strand:+ start:129 stop:401 length:273 start_codon:yes stop_codon:yes gene_type:complete